jgi:hypothetical protein
MRRQHPDVELAAAVRDLAAAVNRLVEQDRAADLVGSAKRASRILTDLIPGKPRT